MKKTPLRRRSKSPTAKLQAQCDKMLTPIVKAMHPQCILCNANTEVAHHHVHKSKSLALRYEIDNLIPLCNKCHLALHHNESYYASIIVSQKGIEWFKKLERIKNQTTVKADIKWYEDQRERLEDVLFHHIQ